MMDPRLQVQQDDEVTAQRGRHPLGPLLRRTPPEIVGTVRLKAVVVLGCASALLATAAWLSPDPRGIGTHEQLGLAPCTMVLVSGVPCPTCGMTTSFAHLVRGQIPQSFHAQPFGFLLALLTGVAAIGACVVLLTGRGWRLNWYRLSPRRLVLIIVVLFGVAWLYKVIVAVA